MTFEIVTATTLRPVMKIQRTITGSNAQTVEALQRELDRCQHELSDCLKRERHRDELLAHLADTVLVADADGRIIDVHPATSSLLGYSRDELSSIPLWDFMTADARQEILGTHLRLMPKVVVASQRRLPNKEGRQRTLDLRLTRYAANGQDLIVATCREDSGGAQAKPVLDNMFAEQSAPEAQVRAIVDAMPSQIWCTCADGSGSFQNQRWLEYAGVSAEAASGWEWRDMIHPDDVEQYVSTWLQIVASGAPGEATARVRRFDGTYRRFLMRAVPVRDEQGEIRGQFKNPAPLV